MKWAIGLVTLGLGVGAAVLWVTIKRADSTPAVPASCGIELVVLGIAQDAGMPQIGNRSDPAWQDPALKRAATALGLIDYVNETRYLFEATPQISQQVQRLDEVTTFTESGLGIDGVFITHAHIGHYAGLMFLGREAAGSAKVPVYAMPRFADFLSENGPWAQLLALENIQLDRMQAAQTVTLSDLVQVQPLQVPHRDEYSETVGFLITTPGQSAFFLPDIDDWDLWQETYGVEIADLVTRVDYAFLDATFYDDHELPGRDMSKIPHPRVRETMDRLQHLPAPLRAGVHFIHINHTNPIRFKDSPETEEVQRRGFAVAEEGQRLCLWPQP